MTNEIKEKIKYLKKVVGIYEGARITEIEDYITNLQNEIFDLKDTIQNKNDCIGAYECIIEDRDKRIDKAIEYIENDIDLTGINGFEKLLDILRGDE